VLLQVASVECSLCIHVLHIKSMYLSIKSVCVHDTKWRDGAQDVRYYTGHACTCTCTLVMHDMLLNFCSIRFTFEKHVINRFTTKYMYNVM
jgi:hypothetical protein